MHQMRISTTKVSSVVLRPEKVGSPKIVGKSRKYQILCHEIEPNPSKDKSMHNPNPMFGKRMSNVSSIIHTILLFKMLN
jgi:hypothetical protein